MPRRCSLASTLPAWPARANDPKRKRKKRRKRSKLKYLYMCRYKMYTIMHSAPSFALFNDLENHKTSRDCGTFRKRSRYPPRRRATVEQSWTTTYRELEAAMIFLTLTTLRSVRSFLGALGICEPFTHDFLLLTVHPAFHFTLLFFLHTFLFHFL